jgi:hypothetical protein
LLCRNVIIVESVVVKSPPHALIVSSWDTETRYSPLGDTYAALIDFECGENSCKHFHFAVCDDGTFLTSWNAME